MDRGSGRLRYDVQAFQLSPNGVPVLFVRAEWLVGTRQGFVASLWVRAGEPIDVLKTDVQQAAWVRSSLFQEGVGPSHTGSDFERSGSRRRWVGGSAVRMGGLTEGRFILSLLEQLARGVPEAPLPLICAAVVDWIRIGPAAQVTSLAGVGVFISSRSPAPSSASSRAIPFADPAGFAGH